MIFDEALYPSESGRSVATLARLRRIWMGRGKGQAKEIQQVIGHAVCLGRAELVRLVQRRAQHAACDMANAAATVDALGENLGGHSQPAFEAMPGDAHPQSVESPRHLNGVLATAIEDGHISGPQKRLARALI
ncbi:hypothetical protein NX04_12330 [Xanthomonas vasicola]|nr:hypothetical protein NX04_12330 [Xanthomonas vasicola]